MTRVNLLEETDDLIPLPQSHRRGLIAVAILACLSFASSTVVLLYLTFKLARWHIRTWKQSRKRQEDTVDLSLGLAQHHFTGETKFDAIGGGRVGGNISQKKPHPNQFLVLLYNLLLADIHQASAFLLNAVWVQHNGIRVRTTTCWAQGWFVSTGDLSSSLFITAIAVHTYLAVVWKWTPPQWALYATVIFLWALNYFLALLGVAITRNGHDAGGFYVRAAAWCWMNIKYETYRLVLHYLWMFISFFITSVLYTLVALSLRKSKVGQSTQTDVPSPPSTADSRTNIRSIYENEPESPHQPLPPNESSLDKISLTTTRVLPRAIPNFHVQSSLSRASTSQAQNESQAQHSHHKAFLLYPIIYVVCTAPLALGRIATMAGIKVPISYFCTAGALITSNGWLDVLLWGLTRHRIVFGAEVDDPETGLESFTFMRTPVGRKYGNMIWVEGGGGNARGRRSGSTAGWQSVDGDEGNATWLGRMKRWVRRAQRGDGGGRALRLGSITNGQSRERKTEPRDGSRTCAMGIHMDIVTSVVVERNELSLPKRGMRSWEKRKSELMSHIAGARSSRVYDDSDGRHAQGGSVKEPE